jgi:hypothetical protein
MMDWTNWGQFAGLRLDGRGSTLQREHSPLSVSKSWGERRGEHNRSRPNPLVLSLTGFRAESNQPTGGS